MALRRAEQSNGAIFAGASMVDFHIPQRWSTPHRAVRAAAAPFDASAAIIAGLVAGCIVLIAWMACSMSIYEEPAWKLPRMMAAIVAGPSALDPEDELVVSIVATGLVLHFLLALGFTATLALLLRPVRAGAVAFSGAAFGLALYAVDLHAMTTIFPWFAPLRTPDTLAAHVLFGVLAATAYRHLSSRH